MTSRAGERIDLVNHEGSRYLPPDELKLAVQVAQATERPLLLFGDPGSGKSTLARYVAYRQDLRYYEHVVTARTVAQDLLWSFDSVRRLGDAQAAVGHRHADDHYVLPGALWWAFDRVGADELARSHEPFGEWNDSRHFRPSVMLIDEIDKADPDLPNSLLAPLAGRYFTVTDVAEGRRITDLGAPPSLIVITSNHERELPPAFERRCVVYRLPQHGKAQLRDIAHEHLRRDGKADRIKKIPIDELIDRLMSARKAADADRRRQPSTAEFLDAVNACLGLDMANDEKKLGSVLKMIFEKDAVIRSERTG